MDSAKLMFGVQPERPRSFDRELLISTQGADSKKEPFHLLEGGHYADFSKALRKRGETSGKFNQWNWHRLYSSSSDLLVVGLGAFESLTTEKMRQLGGAFGLRALAETRGRWVWNIDPLTAAYSGDPGVVDEWISAFLEGFALSTYRYSKYRAKVDSSPDLQFTLTSAHALKRDSLKQKVREILAVREAVFQVRDWSNEPSNIGTPTYYAQEAMRWGKLKGLKVRVLGKREIAREKMGMLLAVSQGSPQEPKVVVVEYVPPRAKKTSQRKRGPKDKTLVLVGKGVTFDSGGISIKPALRMEDMKHDMTGAATVLGAVGLAAALGTHNRVIGILGLVENMPDGGAIQPGNVMISRSGKSVEMINTDAEGRLVLGDLLDFAHGFKPDAIVDIATLTGAVGIALGKMACAVLGNHEELIQRVKDSAKTVDERVWQLPLWDEYFEDLRSEVCDLKNSANDGGGGTIRGAIFLKQFVSNEVPWAHLDIASMANGVSHLNYCPKRGATGLYVRTLAQLARDL
jgi:leucyl aminopeptidase